MEDLTKQQVILILTLRDLLRKKQRPDTRAET
jgi:hypothetical protein